jgi:hypothetical protein
MLLRKTPNPPMSTGRSPDVPGTIGSVSPCLLNRSDIEDDVIHAVLYFQAELLNSGFDCQKQMLKGMIENFLPARQADKKRLTEVSQQNTAVLRQVSEGLLQDYKALHELPDKVTQELRSLSEH